jgi:hypothetical protein
MGGDHLNLLVQLLETPARTRTSTHVAVVATYLGLALILWGHVWFGGNPAHLITCNCGDTAEQVWWFKWLPWAVTHGHNPLLTNALWSRFGGVNALSNTSWLAPAAVLAPITWLFGPVASFNVANLLAPVLSGWAAFALAGRISTRATSRLIAGGLFAFSPFVIRNTVFGHLDLPLTAYLPLVLLLGLKLLSRGGRGTQIGLGLGALTIIQFFTGLEVLALTAITGTLFAIGVLIWRPQIVHAARRQLIAAAAAGGLLSGVVLAYPLWFYFEGPRHVVGPFWRVLSSRPWSIIWAGQNIFNGNGRLAAVGYLGSKGPSADFLGLGLLVAVVASVRWWRRRRSCVIIAAVGVGSWVLEFFPAGLWAKLPLLSGIALIRFALPVSLCVALLLAASIDSWWEALARRWPTSGVGGRRHYARIGVVALVTVAFIPLIVTYSVPFRVTKATVPAWFQRNASHLAPGTAVLTLPFAYGLRSQPMAWQAETNDDFDLIGGWALIPGGNGVNDEMVSHLKGPVAALLAMSRHPLCMTAAQQATVRAALLRWRPLVVVEIPRDAKPGTRAAMTATLGLSPTWSNGAWTWKLDRSTQLGALVDLSTVKGCSATS